MKKEEARIKREKAFGLFTQSYSLDSIAERVKVTKKTIREWKVKYDWQKRFNKINEELDVETNKKLAKILEKRIDLISGIIASGIQDIRNGNTRVTASEILKSLDYLKLIQGEKTGANQGIKLIIQQASDSSSSKDQTATQKAKVVNAGETVREQPESVPAHIKEEEEDDTEAHRADDSDGKEEVEEIPYC